MPMNFKNEIHSVENKSYRKLEFSTANPRPTSQINQNRAPFFAPLAEAKLRTNSKIPVQCSMLYSVL
jgi:hypothetical protein